MKKALALGVSLPIIAFLLFACCPPSPSLRSQNGEKKENQVKTVKVNEDIRIGEVRWKVLEVSKTETIASDYGEPKTANGVYVIVKLEAELLSKEGGSISNSQFAVVDSKERVFTHSTDGELALPSEKKTFVFKDVNPNVPITGYAVFETAKDVTGLKLKIKDLRLFSDEYGLVELGL